MSERKTAQVGALAKVAADLAAELTDLADKVETAGRAGYFVNYQPAVRRARAVIKAYRLQSRRKE